MAHTSPAFDQRPARVRTDWGISGALALTASEARSSLVIVTDVLSFSTTVSVACEQGIGVYPFPHHDPDGAAQLAHTMRATLADSRWEDDASVSPASLRNLDTERLVVPSPRAAQISRTIADRGALLIAGCLRNAKAVAGIAAVHLDASEKHDVVLVPVGEQWPNNTLRPALEDNLAVGAIASRLTTMLPSIRISPETAATVTLWKGTKDISHSIGSGVSGKELRDSGFAEDVSIASDVDATDVVPMLIDGAFMPLGHRTTA